MSVCVCLCVFVLQRYINLPQGQPFPVSILNFSLLSYSRATLSLSSCPHVFYCMLLSFPFLPNTFFPSLYSVFLSSSCFLPSPLPSLYLSCSLSISYCLCFPLLITFPPLLFYSPLSLPPLLHFSRLCPTTLILFLSPPLYLLYSCSLFSCLFLFPFLLSSHLSSEPIPSIVSPGQTKSSPVVYTAFLLNVSIVLRKSNIPAVEGKHNSSMHLWAVKMDTCSAGLSPLLSSLNHSKRGLAVILPLPL